MTFDFVFVTSNSTIRSDRGLSIGYPPASWIKEKDPIFPYEVSHGISHMEIYGLAFSARWPIGLFQVKRHYSTPCEIDILSYSWEKLKKFCSLNHHLNILMNFPGEGAIIKGQVSEKEILSVISGKPHNLELRKVYSNESTRAKLIPDRSAENWNDFTFSCTGGPR